MAAPNVVEARRRARGNAYLVTVAVMLIVTLLGLSLGAVTQTEMLIGSRQRNNQRVFYIAESGLNLAVAKFMVQNETRASRLTWDVPAAYSTGVDLNAVVRLAPIVATAKPPCNLCGIGESTEANAEILFNLRNAITVRAFLEADGGQVLAQRRVSSLVDIQPWPAPEGTAGILDEQLADVEYN